MLALLAGGLTEATMALGGRGGLSNDTLLRSLHQTATPTPTPPAATPTVAPSPTVVSTPAPTVTPAATPVAPKATTNSFVHMRAGKSTSTAIVMDLNGGTVVELLSDSDAQWQQVRYNGVTGYIFKTYLAY